MFWVIFAIIVVPILLMALFGNLDAYLYHRKKSKTNAPVKP